MTSPASAPDDPHAALNRLLWAPQNSLATWARDAACAVIDQLPVGVERAGYRHEASADDAGIVTHELVELESSLPFCVVDEHPDGSRVLGVCQPWPSMLLRFVAAILDGDLAGELLTFSHQTISGQ